MATFGVISFTCNEDAAPMIRCMCTKMHVVKELYRVLKMYSLAFPTHLSVIG